MNKNNSDNFLEIINLIYDSGINRHKWNSTLEVISKTVNFETYSVVEAHDDSRVCSLIYDNFDEDHFWKEMNHYYKYLAPIYKYKTNNKYFEIFYDYLQVEEHETNKNEFYDWACRHEMKYQLAARLSPENQAQTIHLSLRRSQKRGHATPEEINTLSLLRGHMERALLMSHQLGRDQADLMSFDALMESLSVGVAMISVDGHLTKANQEFEDVINRHSGIKLRNGRLMLAQRGLQQEFDRKLDRTLASRKSQTGPRGDSLMFHPSPLDPMTMVGMQLYPITKRAAFELGSEDAVILLVQSSRNISRKAIEVFSSTHGLTPRETSILEYLLHGYSLERFAKKHKISANTARWHMQNLLNKTGHKSQGQLLSSARSMLFFR